MGNDYTDTYGFNDVNGILSPVLAKQFKSDVKNCILDGKMMCYDTNNKCFATKGDALRYTFSDDIINLYCL